MRMRIAILSIADKGNLEKERLVLRVRATADVGDYILIQTGFQQDGVTIDTHHTYWFPYKKVEAGDLLVIYTKEGRENQRALENGKNVHFFYWGLPEPIWATKDRAPVLLYAPVWISKEPQKL